MHLRARREDWAVFEVRTICEEGSTGLCAYPWAGLLALLAVSVETSVILVSYINKLRLEGKDIREATHEAALLRLRPIMMTALVACLGLLTAALATGVARIHRSLSPS